MIYIKQSILLCLFCATTTFLRAQSGTMSSDTLAFRESIMLKQKLGLSESQQQRVYTLNKAYRDDLKTIYSIPPTDPNKGKELRKSYNKYDQKMKQLLTSNQYAQYKSLTEARMNNLQAKASAKKVKVKSVPSN